PQCHNSSATCFFGAICGNGPITSLTRRCTRPATAGFARLRRRVNSNVKPHQKSMNVGFVVVLFVAAVLVVIPTAVALRFSWRRGGIARGASAFSALLLAGVAWLFLATTGWPNSLEEKVVLFLAVWAMLFVVLGAAIAVVVMLRRILLRHERSTQ
ncbi:hypothetical protein O4H66_28450, partial [Comamonadaceae bacterium G21597-S1]|nr:hypothetical protein [Comamonadaceae bacterium G21597-S1]